MHRDGTPGEASEGHGTAPQTAGATRPGAASRPTDTLLVCLLRLARELGRPVDEAELRNACPVPETGMTVAAFARAARRLGYGVGRTPLDAAALGALAPPYVALGKPSEGAVLVTARDGDAMTVFRPTEGRQAAMAADELLARASEVLVLTATDEPGAARGWRAAIAGRIRRIAAEMTLASAMLNLFALASPLFVMTVYNKVIGHQALGTLEVLAAGMITLYAFELMLRGIRGYISSHTGARLDALIGGEAVHRLVNLSFRQFENTSTGLMSERLRQIDTIRQFFTGQMPLVLVDLAFVFLFVAALFYLSPALAAAVIAAIPVFVGISALFHRTQKRLVEDNFAALAAKTSALAETVSNALTVKALGLEAEMERRFASRLALSAWTGFRANHISNLVGAFGNTLQQAVGLAIIWIGAQLVIEGRFSVGALIAANLLASRALQPMRQVVSAWSQLQEVRAAFRRLDELMDAESDERPGGYGPAPRIEGRLTFENVTYAYEPGLPPALRNMSFTIAEGEVVGLMGPLGSGKSTLVKLLQGLYAPSAGRILIDETDIAHVAPASLRRQIGVVPQEVQLFAGTVRENIAMGAPDSSPERVMASARFVGAHEFIQHLPKGYETVLRERGAGLSAGQRQLLCIARAMMRNPRILILDEATSGLDAASEEAFLRNLRRAAMGRTVIIISHRIAPLTIADRVLLVVDGGIKAEGPPSKILEQIGAASKPRVPDGGGADAPVAAEAGAGA